MINDNKTYNCPCCGEAVIDEPGCYEICPVCGWEDDPVQSTDPDYEGGANKMSLKSAQLAYNTSK
ncbi:hypothetical protein HB991_18625 [Yersinia mollaretii]|uniref:Cysteine-rich CPCC domain-containing protein n=1 Tax=Yersinia mollaretii TaxID=33060 RepID=A0AA44CPF9_YERMO|nr:CPCC family cysteine-rich protein [Yersinia mollaretii]MDA5527825.1 CPCC family cysteine-rich protein [Yersinia mollaretii]MDR7873986.1 CPCC family cysteine-rich protein [Yersinia mollaretii]NIL24514.1 hypothetical protein [Yersinia mollaretii]PHZ31300.1 hypothetical protein CS537_13350 [Yersinia mollaretii]WQC74413.1 CPCC family cysteine-rich protein [Yersinia mollaretii]